MDMAASVDEQLVVECGFCCSKNGLLEEPKVLPCTHIHCLRCLSAYFEINAIVQCPRADCSKVFDVKLKELPAWKGCTEIKYCDICIRKDKVNKPAISFCPTCDRKYCFKHEQWHDEGFDDHIKMSLDEYKVKEGKRKERTCERHPDEPYNVGCKNCLSVTCLQCLADFGNCKTGTSHELLSLKDLVAEMSAKIRELKDQLMKKEGELEDLFKATSKAAADFDDETEEMLRLLHETRDEQLQAIKVKYDVIEKEYIESRQTTKASITEFKEDLVWEKWTELRNQRFMFESKLPRKHQVDMVTGFEAIREELQRLTDLELPKLKLESASRLTRGDKNREVEIKLASTSHVLSATSSLPVSLALKKTVKLPAQPLSISTSDGNVYVALENKNGVQTGDITTGKTKSFLNFNNYINGMALHGQRVYTLVNGNPSVIYVHDLSGNLLNQWDHLDVNSNYNGLSVCSDWLLACDRKNKKLMLYSLGGKKVRKISFLQLGNAQISTCPADNESVIISDKSTSKVHRVNITTGEVMWTCEVLSEPQGVTGYGEKYLLVARYASDTISILDIQTSDVVSELKAPEIQSDHIMDLEIFEDSLIAGDWKSKTLHIYQFNRE